MDANKDEPQIDARYTQIDYRQIYAQFGKRVDEGKLPDDPPSLGVQEHF
jgi:hypothetical protein